MQIPKDATLLQIFCSEDDRREMQFAGAAVLRRPMGFGQSSRLHIAKILRPSELQLLHYGAAGLAQRGGTP